MAEPIFDPDHLGPPSSPLYTLDEVIREVERVIAERRATYPKVVQRGILEREEAYRRIALLEECVARLRRIARQEVGEGAEVPVE
jgi:hypothetical protein